MSHPWMEGDKFSIRNCKIAKRYIEYYLDIQDRELINVTNTGTFLVINYVQCGQLKVFKITIPAKVLYCLKAQDFTPFFEEYRRCDTTNFWKGF